MKAVWKEHPLALAGVVEELPIEWVWQYRGYDVTEHIEYGDGTGSELPGLWERLQKEGMTDPLIMRVGLNNKKFRLEAGNHRIQVLKQHGITTVPVTVQVRHECGPLAPGPMTDAEAVYDFPEEGIKISEMTVEYVKPSDVFWGFDSKR